MLVVQSFSLLAVLATPALCHVKRQSPAEASSILSEVQAAITEIPSAINGIGSELASDLAALIGQVDPTGVVGDIPSLLSTNLPAIETLLDTFLTQAIPPGAVPSSILAEIPTFVSEVFPALVSEVDGLVTQLPSTLALSALPGLVTAGISAIGSDLESFASELVPALSTFLFAPTASASASVTSSVTPSRTTGVNGTAAKTTAPKVSATFTGAGATWKAELGIVLGFAAVVAML